MKIGDVVFFVTSPRRHLALRRGKGATDLKVAEVMHARQDQCFDGVNADGVGVTRLEQRGPTQGGLLFWRCLDNARAKEMVGSIRSLHSALSRAGVRCSSAPARRLYDNIGDQDRSDLPCSGHAASFGAVQIAQLAQRAQCAGSRTIRGDRRKRRRFDPLAQRFWGTANICASPSTALSSHGGNIPSGHRRKRFSFHPKPPTAGCRQS